jgi:hypothetical protein
VALDQTTRNEVRVAVLETVRMHPGSSASSILDSVFFVMDWDRFTRETLYRPVDMALQYNRKAGRIRYDRLGHRWGWFPVAEGSK